MIHNIKIQKRDYEDIIHNKKTFEIRFNDRDYKVGDYLSLIETENGRRTGGWLIVKVKYILTSNDFEGIKDGYCVMGIDKRSYSTVAGDCYAYYQLAH